MITGNFKLKLCILLIGMFFLLCKDLHDYTSDGFFTVPCSYTFEFLAIQEDTVFQGKIS